MVSVSVEMQASVMMWSVMIQYATLGSSRNMWRLYVAQYLMDKLEHPVRLSGCPNIPHRYGCQDFINYDGKCLAPCREF